MTARVKDLLMGAGVNIILWALCKNRKLMLAVAKKMVAKLTIKELVRMSLDIKAAVKNVK